MSKVIILIFAMSVIGSLSVSTLKCALAFRPALFDRTDKKVKVKKIKFRGLDGTLK